MNSRKLLTRGLSIDGQERTIRLFKSKKRIRRKLLSEQFQED